MAGELKKALEVLDRIQRKPPKIESAGRHISIPFQDVEYLEYKVGKILLGFKGHRQDIKNGHIVKLDDTPIWMAVNHIEHRMDDDVGAITWIQAGRIRRG